MSRFAAIVRCGVATLLIALAVIPSVAAASAPRTFVASNGVDTNPCSIAQPCRSFAAAIGKTNPGGEVIVRDSAGYGPVTITQSISIIAPPAVYAGISVPAGMSGIVVNDSGSLGIFVKLSGLTINGEGGQNGIEVLGALELVVEHCMVIGMSNIGLVAPASGVVGGLYIVDSTFRASANGGIDLSNSVGTATIDRVHLENNGGDGLHVLAPFSSASVLVRNSVASGNGGAGFGIVGTAQSFARLTVERSTAFQNGSNGFQIISTGSTGEMGAPGVKLVVADSKALENVQSGVFANGVGATAVISGSTLARNVEYGAVQMSSSTVVTFQNNAIELNTLGPTTGTITKNSRQ